MFKAIREFFTEKKDEPKIGRLESVAIANKHPLDFLFEDSDIEPRQRSLRPQDYPMVGEPVRTLIKSLRENPKRFKIQMISDREYLNHVAAEFVYKWMYHTNFGKFTDTKTGLSKTFAIHEGDLYRVDGLEFNLNAWEKKALQLAFNKVLGRKEARKRRQQMKASRMTRERLAKDALEKIERLKYAELFK